MIYLVVIRPIKLWNIKRLNNCILLKPWTIIHQYKYLQVTQFLRSWSQNGFSRNIQPCLPHRQDISYRILWPALLRPRPRLDEEVQHQTLQLYVPLVLSCRLREMSRWQMDCCLQIIWSIWRGRTTWYQMQLQISQCNWIRKNICVLR